MDLLQKRDALMLAEFLVKSLFDEFAHVVLLELVEFWGDSHGST